MSERFGHKRNGLSLCRLQRTAEAANMGLVEWNVAEGDAGPVAISGLPEITIATLANKGTPLLHGVLMHIHVVIAESVMTRLLLCVMCLLSPTVWAIEFSSSNLQATVVELYTSEGCSSCPPADRWLSSLKSDPRLFKSLIPMAFHVDYWDELGWPDRFAQTQFSQRQRSLAEQGLLSQVYTPGLVVNSQEWRAWFNGVRDVPSLADPAGQLTAHYDDGKLAVNFPERSRYELNVAVLGMGLVTEVTAGENRGRRLQHDFVVLALYQQAGMTDWYLTLDMLPDRGQQQTILAVWLTKPGSLEIVQAAATIVD